MRKSVETFGRNLLLMILAAILMFGMAPGLFAEESEIQAEATAVQTEQIQHVDQNEEVAAPAESENGQTEEAVLQESPKAYVTLSGNVSLSGKDLTDKEFSITLKDVTDSSNKKEIFTINNDVQGNYTYTLVFDEEGTYQYELSQEASNETGISIDNHTYAFNVKVEKEESGELTAKVSDKDNKEIDLKAFNFNNLFSKTNNVSTVSAAASTDSSSQDSPDTYRFSGKITLTGKTLIKDEFTVSVKETTETTAEADRKSLTKKNEANGTFSFDPIKYEKAGEYTYTISQVKSTETGITSDTSVYKATVKVKEDGGSFTTELTKLTKGDDETNLLTNDNKDDDVIVFANKYTATYNTSSVTTGTKSSGTATGTANNTTAKATSNPKTGDSSNIGLYSALLVGFMIVLAGTLFSFRKKKN